MLGRWWRGDGVERPAVSVDFDHALTREVLRTELVRIKSLIATALVLVVVLWAVDLIAPEGLDNIWRGRFRPIYLSVILIPFILFELWVHGNIRRHLRVRPETSGGIAEFSEHEAD
jgi:adenylate cyclase